MLFAIAQWAYERALAWWAEWRRERSFGERGEDRAAEHLEGLGYTIIARGARDKLGELDLVAADGETVVFVEVKTRRSHEAGHPLEAVTATKQRRISRLAAAYVHRHHLEGCSCRFDVVAITWPDDAPPTIEHVQHAFESTE